MATWQSVIGASVIAALAAYGMPASAQTATVRAVPPPRLSGHPRVIVPDSSLPHLERGGHHAHTHLRVLNVDAAPDQAPYAGYLYETPASLACVYGLVTATNGCNPQIVSVNASGGSGVIAIVDAYDDPNALSDLKAFSVQFGLPTPNLQVVYAAGTQPAQDPTGGWELEESLDIEMAHSLAPQAKIILVEAASSNDADLYYAESVAAQLVHNAGGGQVSNSWGESEYSYETSNDAVFVKTNVTFFASSGDAPGTSYPAVSPNVIAVGGTSISRNLTTGDFQTQITWDQAGGGLSFYEPAPAFQSSRSAVAAVVGAYRGTPDVAFDANPETGVWIYDTVPYEGSTGWWIVGGTSVAAPAMAAIVNASGKLAASSAAENNTLIYKYHTNAADFTPVVSGGCSFYEGYLASKNYNLCTGVGTPFGYGGK